MKKLFLFLILFALLVSCRENSELSLEFNCEAYDIPNKESVEDVKKSFSVTIPKHWKTNLFYDDIQSSIYTADTTRELSKTVIIDVTQVSKSVNFSKDFILKLEQDNLNEQLIKIVDRKIQLLKKPSLLVVFKGTKQNMVYRKMENYIQLNENNFLLVKTEVYGEALASERFCEAINMIEKIVLK